MDRNNIDEKYQWDLSKIYESIDEVLYTKVMNNGLTVFINKKKGFNKIFSSFVTNFGAYDIKFIPTSKRRKDAIVFYVFALLSRFLFSALPNLFCLLLWVHFIIINRTPPCLIIFGKNLS